MTHPHKHGALWVKVDGKWKMNFCPFYLAQCWKYLPDSMKVSP